MTRIWPWPRTSQPAAQLLPLRSVQELDDELHEENSARAQLAHWQVLVGALTVQLRQRNRAYGRASAEIGRLRGQLARAREQLRDEPVRFVPADPVAAAAVLEGALRYGQELDAERRDGDAVSRTEVERLARVINDADRALDGLPAWDELADTGRHDYLRLARYIVRAGWRAPASTAEPAETAVGR